MNSLSPCKKECKLDENQEYCVSCFRTINEISGWENFSDIAKRKILLKLNNRK